MRKKKVFILLGHEDGETLSGRFCDAYEKGAHEAGHEVRRMNIGDMKFDPILHKGYKEIQKLEPDLVKVQENLKWCDHFALFYPNWWGSMPAILKGMFDRMFLPGFAFQFKKEGFLKGISWKKFLKGRSAYVHITMNNHPLLARLFFGDNSNEIKKNILEFAGISPVHIVKKGPVERMPEADLKRLEHKAYKDGKIAW